MKLISIDGYPIFLQFPTNNDTTTYIRVLNIPLSGNIREHRLLSSQNVTQFHPRFNPIHLVLHLLRDKLYRVSCYESQLVISKGKRSEEKSFFKKLVHSFFSSSSFDTYFAVKGGAMGHLFIA